MSDLPKGYLRCARCTSAFPGTTEDGKPVERCPGCGFSADASRPKTARMAMRLLDPTATGLSVAGGGGRFGAVEIFAIVLIVGSIVGGVAFLLLRR